MIAPHVPVLLEEVMAALALQAGETYVDGTFGAGGYTRAALEKGIARAYAFDRDPTAIADAFHDERLTLIEERFSQMDEALEARGVTTVDAIALDIGVSSMQLDRPERGFSYAVDAPLDMRMNPRAEISAREIVNDWSERDLAQIFKRYGEERYARQIARAIGRERRRRPIERTGELVEIIRSAIPAPARFGDGHPAKRVFQALRIAVNDELGELEAALPAAFDMLRPEGRLAVISFHSLEDRLVKRFLRDKEKGCTCPPDFPICVCGKEPELRALGRKAVRPSNREVAANPRSASARLRAAVRTG
jgi:16S rRNA (cytosine1402-N4)-methyltransferase